jgi:hypothetical protein
MYLQFSHGNCLWWAPVVCSLYHDVIKCLRRKGSMQKVPRTEWLRNETELVQLMCLRLSAQTQTLRWAWNASSYYGESQEALVGGEWVRWQSNRTHPWADGAKPAIIKIDTELPNMLVTRQPYFVLGTFMVGSWELSARVGFELWSSWSSASWVARITGVSH